MNTPIIDFNNPFGPTRTRWDELKETLSTIVELATILDQNGIDIYFLNRGTLRNVSNLTTINEAFQAPPEGGTPIATTLQQVIKESKESLGEKKLLIIICTDGQPTDSKNNVDIQGLKTVMNTQRNPIDRIYTTFVACTDDDETIKYLNKWDKEMKHVDVIDDYISERKEVVEAQGPDFTFTRGDYIVKILLGSIVPEIGGLDKKKSSGNNTSSCIIL